MKSCKSPKTRPIQWTKEENYYSISERTNDRTKENKEKWRKKENGENERRRKGSKEER